ncbi:integrase [Gossypium australe]|uniref:Integrase n=1 Tax=Gossypium australe TaxID=47621 RepID=A0A5B6VN64_9ROSI|nr:integrase [Gossypium australe]
MVYSDGLLNGLGCVLIQEGKVVAYASQKLKSHEKNYLMHDLEPALVLNLRQHRWLELLKDYDLIIDYNPRKANIVADAVSRKSFFSLRAMNTCLILESDGVDGSLYFWDRLCDVKREILREAHYNAYLIHPGSNKMYNDLKQMYW